MYINLHEQCMPCVRDSESHLFAKDIIELKAFLKAMDVYQITHYTSSVLISQDLVQSGLNLKYRGSSPPFGPYLVSTEK